MYNFFTLGANYNRLLISDNSTQLVRLSKTFATRCASRFVYRIRPSLIYLYQSIVDTYEKEQYSNERGREKIAF
jgi:hypothetical protein